MIQYLISSPKRDIWQLVIRNSDPEYKDYILMLSRNAPYIFVFFGKGEGGAVRGQYHLVSYYIIIVIPRGYSIKMLLML